MRRWSGRALATLGLVAWSLGIGLVRAAEHGGQEHGGTAQAPGGTTQAPGGTTQEHGGAAQAEPSTEQIRQAIREYIAGIEVEDGAFTIEDEVTNATRTLTLERVHDRVGKTGELYYACTDMRDTSSNQLLDLDFDVEASSGVLEVVDVRIHKVDGQARYTYDAQDNRIPLTATP